MGLKEANKNLTKTAKMLLKSEDAAHKNLENKAIELITDKVVGKFTKGYLFRTQSIVFEVAKSTR